MRGIQVEITKGNSGSGKTTILFEIEKALKKAGYSVFIATENISEKKADELRENNDVVLIDSSIPNFKD